MLHYQVVNMVRRYQIMHINSFMDNCLRAPNHETHEAARRSDDAQLTGECSSVKQRGSWHVCIGWGTFTIGWEREGEDAAGHGDPMVPPD
jgi:hypothetical protein